MKLNDDDLSQSGLDFVVWQSASLSEIRLLMKLSNDSGGGVLGNRFRSAKSESFVTSAVLPPLSKAQCGRPN
jgi:hypothetical protein